MTEAKPRSLSYLPPLIAAFVFFTGIFGDFIFDDVALLEKDEGLRSFDLHRMFWTNYWADTRFDINYRPFVLFTYGLNHLVSHAPMGFLVVNVLLNSLMAYLVYRLFRVLLGNDLLAVLAASLYAVLPIHTEAVVNVVGRAELLAGIAVISAWLIAATRGERGESAASAVAAGALIFLGVCSKESTVVIVPILIAWSIVVRTPLPIKTLTACCVAIVAYLGLRQAALAEQLSLLAEGNAILVTEIDNPLYGTYTDSLTRALNGIRLQGHYVLQTIIPWTMSADYSYNQVPVLAVSSPRLWLEIAAWLLPATGLGYYFWRSNKRAACLAILFFPIAFAVTGNFLFGVGTIYGERLAYLPSLALPLLLAGSFSATCQQPEEATQGEHCKAAMAILISLASIYSIRTTDRILDWKHRDSHYAQMASASPDSTRAASMLAGAWFRKARESTDPSIKERAYDEAIAQALRSVEIYPLNVHALGLLGVIYSYRAEDAAVIGERKLAPEHLVASDSYFTRAFDARKQRLQAMPMKFWILRGQVRRRMAQMPAFEAASASLLKQAFDDFEHFLEITKNSGSKVDRAESLNNRGLVQGMMGQQARVANNEAEASRLWQSARADFDASIRLDPDRPAAYNNRGFLRNLSGDYQGALEDYGRGLNACRKLGDLTTPLPEHSVASFLDKRAQLYRRMGDESSAKREENIAKELLEKRQDG